MSSYEGTWRQTLTGERFLLAEYGDSLRVLAEDENIYIDGTFKSCPQLLYQISTIHAFLFGQQFPSWYTAYSHLENLQKYTLDCLKS